MPNAAFLLRYRSLTRRLKQNDQNDKQTCNTPIIIDRNEPIINGGNHDKST